MLIFYGCVRHFIYFSISLTFKEAMNKQNECFFYELVTYSIELALQGTTTCICLSSLTNNLFLRDSNKENISTGLK